MILFWSVAGVVLSAIPALLFLRNLPLFCVDMPEPIDASSPPSVSVLIPARDEAAGIRKSVLAALANQGVDVEVVVLDDHSTDATPDIVQELSQQDRRVRYVMGKELPGDWNGKQFACLQLAEAASHQRMVFIDADVHLRKHALSQLIARQDQTEVALLSAFPYQQTSTLLEKWLIPLIHYILLGFLPMARMRSTVDPAFAAGCGQLFVTLKSDYQRAGTHAAIKASRHDGLKLPRVYRTAGLSTDVIDGTDLADCRMYEGAGQVIRGVLKNASEGIANPKLIVIFTILLLGASLLPLLTLILSVLEGETLAIVVSLVGIVLAHVPRFVAAIRFRQAWIGVLFHSVATPMFVALQWVALANHLMGRKVAWRGRH
jgi:hypothetical protein